MMPRADLYIIEWTFLDSDDDWWIIPKHIGEAAHARKADAYELLDYLHSDTLATNVRYRVRRAMFLDSNTKPEPPGRAARKCVRRSPPSARTRESGPARGPDLCRGLGRPHPPSSGGEA